MARRVANSSAESRASVSRAILIARELKKDGDPLEILTQAGHILRFVPLSDHRPLPDPDLVRSAVRALGTEQWVAVTSARAVEALASLGAEATEFFARPDLFWACVGPTSADAVSQRTGRPPALVSAEMSAADLGRDLATRLGDASDRVVLFLCASNARPDLPLALEARGITVQIVVTYETVPRVPSAIELEPPSGHDRWDAIVLTSGLAVHTLIRALRETSPPETTDAQLRQVLMQNRPVVLGRTAEAALGEYGIEAWLRSPRPTMEDLAQALLKRLEAT